MKASFLLLSPCTIFAEERELLSFPDGEGSDVPLLLVEEDGLTVGVYGNRIGLPFGR